MHFMSGYTSKLAGTEARSHRAPGHVFCVLRRTVPASAGERVRQNAGRTDRQTQFPGVHGEHRLVRRTLRRKESASESGTRAMVSAALNGELNDAEYVPHPVFGVFVPRSVPDVPSEILDPRNTWSDANAYDEAARALAREFTANFSKFSGVPSEVANAGPAAG